MQKFGKSRNAKYQSRISDGWHSAGKYWIQLWNYKTFKGRIQSAVQHLNYINGI